MSKFFTDIQKDEIDMMRNTKNYTMRTRLNREINYSEDFKKKYLTQEYGNYDKYDKNKISTIYKEDERT